MGKYINTFFNNSLIKKVIGIGTYSFWIMFKYKTYLIVLYHYNTFKNNKFTHNNFKEGYE